MHQKFCALFGSVNLVQFVKAVFIFFIPKFLYNSIVTPFLPILRFELSPIPYTLTSFQSKAQQVITKNPFFSKKFLLLFPHRVTRIGNRESRTFFASNAHFRPISGREVLFRNAMKKQNTAFTLNFYLFTLYSSCLGVFVAEIQSIKNNKLCETNPISQKPKMKLTFYSTSDYENKSGFLPMGKQTQTNPILEGIHYCVPKSPIFLNLRIFLNNLFCLLFFELSEFFSKAFIEQS